MKARRVVQSAGPLAPMADEMQVRVAVVIAAFNEERHILQRVENLLQQSYPADRLTIYVGSDGSTDGTNALLQSIASARVLVSCFAANRGKSSVLNDLVAQTSEPLVIFTDANTEFAPLAVAELVRRFRESTVGCVCGELRLRQSSGDNQDSMFWRVEQFLKKSEAGLDALLGANGAIYAIRRELYTPLPGDTIVDDFIIAMRIKSTGWRLVYEPLAVAFEETPAGIDDEFKRRLRIGIGNYQALFRYPEFFWNNGIATKFSYFSHKVLRWLTPHLLLVALVCSALLSGNPVYRWLLGLQVCGYGLAALLYSTRRVIRLRGPVASIVYLLTLNAAFGVSFLIYLSGKGKGTWKRTARV
jgi:cellulose synthase/poly-beta-1,6-N-acetylglucosamine synthase-like glycosyltransferase